MGGARDCVHGRVHDDGSVENQRRIPGRDVLRAQYRCATESVEVVLEGDDERHVGPLRSLEKRQPRDGPMDAFDSHQQVCSLGFASVGRPGWLGERPAEVGGRARKLSGVFFEMFWEMLKYAQSCTRAAV
jgi:hypothetical protein